MPPGRGVNSVSREAYMAMTADMNRDAAMQWLRASGLDTMPQQDVIARLQAMYSGVNPNSLLQAPASVDPNYNAYAPEAYNGNTRWLTPQFDPSFSGGQYGGYYGAFGQDGALQNVGFAPMQRSDGFVADNIETIGPMAVLAAAALGGGLIGGGSAISGGAGDAALAGGAAGDTLGAAGAAGAGAAPIGASAITNLGPAATIGDSLGYLTGGALGTGSALSGMSGSALGSLAGGALSLANGLSQPRSQTVTSQRSTDPRVDQMLFGQLAPGLQQQMNAQPSPGLQSLFGSADQYFANGTAQNLQNAGTDAIIKQLTGNVQAPQMQAAQMQAANAQGVDTSGIRMDAANLRDPNQQGINLQPGFEQFIYGDQGANPYLSGALQRGADQATDNYRNVLGDMAETMTEKILPNIRGGAIQAGGYGGSRQGIAEGIAAREFAQEAGRSATNVGRDLNSAMIGAQSANFMQGRQLGAGLLGSLSGAQYGQNQYGAGLQQQANATNAGLGMTGATLAQNNNQFNANLLQGANANNAGWQQQAGANNLQSLLSTNNLNSSNLNAGIGNAWNQYSGMANLANNANNWGLNRQIAGMNALQPWASMYSTQSTTQPLYQTHVANLLGGGLAGAQLGRNLFG